MLDTLMVILMVDTSMIMILQKTMISYGSQIIIIYNHLYINIFGKLTSNKYPIQDSP